MCQRAMSPTTGDAPFTSITPVRPSGSCEGNPPAVRRTGDEIDPRPLEVLRPHPASKLEDRFSTRHRGDDEAG